ncbi:probable serine/threonine-protein kinase DDB_G0284251 [Parasteatoda tepidariorum]|uniref:probable serine/threonine-protein kinase DDB_G0284251 n=1 Tax=Parasteatoda tepidariorum TaxID=114398 RepID=UPI0039BC5900
MGDHFDESDHDLGQEEPMLPDSSGQRYQHKRDAMKVLEANHFVFIEKLGSGAFGDVYKMMDFSGQEVAVKVVSLEVTKKSEIEIWPKMRHPNIIPLLQYISFSNPDVGVFVMPVHWGTLKDVVVDRHFLSQTCALDCLKSWLYDTLCGLNYLHSNEACHLDLKSDNILISQDYRAVICDFSCLASATKAIPR